MNNAFNKNPNTLAYSRQNQLFAISKESENWSLLKEIYQQFVDYSKSKNSSNFGNLTRHINISSFTEYTFDSLINLLLPHVKNPMLMWDFFVQSEGKEWLALVSPNLKLDSFTTIDSCLHRLQKDICEKLSNNLHITKEKSGQYYTFSFENTGMINSSQNHIAEVALLMTYKILQHLFKRKMSLEVLYIPMTRSCFNLLEAGNITNTIASEHFGEFQMVIKFQREF